MWKYGIIKFLITLVMGVWTILFIRLGAEASETMKTILMTIGVFPVICFTGEFLDANLKDKFKDKE